MSAPGTFTAKGVLRAHELLLAFEQGKAEDFARLSEKVDAEVVSGLLAFALNGARSLAPSAELTRDVINAQRTVLVDAAVLFHRTYDTNGDR